MALGRVFGTSMTPRILEHGEPHRIPPSEFGLRETGSDGGRKSPHWTLVGNLSSRATRPGRMGLPRRFPSEALRDRSGLFRGTGRSRARPNPGFRETPARMAHRMRPDGPWSRRHPRGLLCHELLPL